MEKIPKEHNYHVPQVFNSLRKRALVYRPKKKTCCCTIFSGIYQKQDENWVYLASKGGNNECSSKSVWRDGNKTREWGEWKEPPPPSLKQDFQQWKEFFVLFSLPLVDQNLEEHNITERSVNNNHFKHNISLGGLKFLWFTWCSSQ